MFKKPVRRRVRLTRPGFKPGTAPGTLVAHPDSPHPVVTATTYHEGEVETQTLADLSGVKALREQRGHLWLDVTGLGDAGVFEALGQEFGISTLVLEDILNIPQRPKLDAYSGFVYIVMRMPRSHEELATEQLSILVGPDFLITIQEYPGDTFDPVRKRLQVEGSRLRQMGVDYLAFALMDTVVDGYMPMVERYTDRIDQIEDRVADADADTLQELHWLKRDLVVLRRYLYPTRDVLALLVKDDNDFVSRDVRPYFLDVYDHVRSTYELVESYRDIVSSLVELHMSYASQRMNETMKVLTIIGTIFIPLSFIVGLYGMNFDTGSPFNLPELGWKYGYPAVWAVMIALTVFMMGYFKRKGWW